MIHLRFKMKIKSVFLQNLKFVVFQIKKRYLERPSYDLLSYQLAINNEFLHICEFLICGIISQSKPFSEKVEQKKKWTDQILFKKQFNYLQIKEDLIKSLEHSLMFQNYFYIFMVDKEQHSEQV